MKNHLVKLKTYAEISEEFNGKVPYYAQLETKEWHEKREKIRNSHLNECQHCGGECVVTFIPKGLYNGLIFVPAILKEVEVNKEQIIPFTDEIIKYTVKEVQLVPAGNPLFAHVHHKYYILDKLAWEYPDDALVLLCHKCHLNFHKENKVPIYLDDSMVETKDLTPCFRCFGAGHFPEYNHVQNGICFRCRGARYEELIVEE